MLLFFSSRRFVRRVALAAAAVGNLVAGDIGGGGGNRDLASAAASVVLDFEGIGDVVEIKNYYNGVRGPNYGVVFENAYTLVDKDAGGTADIANEPSPSTVLLYFNGGGPVMTVAAGFTFLSFYYASEYDTAMTVYDGVSGAGTVLANVSLPSTGTCSACGDPNGQLGKWKVLTVNLLRTAKSIVFSGASAAVDNMTITFAPPPTKPPTEQPTSAPCTKTSYWLWNPSTNKLVSELTNNTSTCIPEPYNIEVRPCTDPTTPPVVIALKAAPKRKKGSSSSSGGDAVQMRGDYRSPFYLWGDNFATGDVYPSTKPLPKGTYVLKSKVDGKIEKITFTQTC